MTYLDSVEIVAVADPMMEEVPCQEASIAVAVAETPLSFVRNHRMPQQSFTQSIN